MIPEQAVIPEHLRVGRWVTVKMADGFWRAEEILAIERLEWSGRLNDHFSLKTSIAWVPLDNYPPERTFDTKAEALVWIAEAKIEKLETELKAALKAASLERKKVRFLVDVLKGFNIDGWAETLKSMP